MTSVERNSVNVQYTLSAAAAVVSCDRPSLNTIRCNQPSGLGTVTTIAVTEVRYRPTSFIAGRLTPFIVLCSAAAVEAVNRCSRVEIKEREVACAVGRNCHNDPSHIDAHARYS